MQRGGQVVLRMLANVQQKTIQPIIEAAVAKGTRIHTDEYDIYARLPAWGYQHKTVCHGRGEYARDEDGDGFCEIHVNTIEGTWSLDLLRKSGEFPMSYEELDDTAATVYEGI